MEYNDPAVNKRGFHKKVTYQGPLAVDPNISITDAASLYTKKPSAVELFFQRGPLAANVVQLTGLTIIDSGNDGLGGTYQTIQAPFGIKFIMGQVNAASGSRTITLSGTTVFAFSMFTHLATCFGGGAVAVSFSPGPGTNQANINTAANVGAKWLVIQP